MLSPARCQGGNAREKFMTGGAMLLKTGGVNAPEKSGPGGGNAREKSQRKISLVLMPFLAA